MEALQHYYTSYVNKENGSGGFQTKGISPGVSSDAQTTIIRLISYRVPPSLEEKPLATHPIALRYYYKDTKEAILLCSQSSGKDEYGRSGNFFAHSLIVKPELFKQVPPILFWGSSFWHGRDDDAPDRFNNGLPML